MIVGGPVALLDAWAIVIRHVWAIGYELWDLFLVLSCWIRHLVSFERQHAMGCFPGVKRGDRSRCASKSEGPS